MNLKLPLLLGCCLLVATTTCAGTSGSLGEDAPGKNKAEVYITTADRQQSFNHITQELSKVSASESVITINPTVRYQEMDGFGAAVTGSTCYNLMQMTPTDRTKFLTETFSDKNGLGFSYIRISIGCSDFSLSEYTCCDTKGIENFALQTEEKEYVIPILKDILALNPTIKILGSPWTCPKWMKVNNLEERKPFDSWTSGQLNPDYYSDYATYFVKWIQAFRDEGIEIYSVTPQNEPLNRGNSASLFMGWKEEQAFVRDALGPAFKAAGLDTKIYAFDHNYNYDNMADQQEYPVRMYDDEVAAAFLTGAVDINRGDYKTMTYNSHYYIIGHLSSVVKLGAVRVESKGVDEKGLMYSAFENPDGTVAFVLLNEGNEETRLTVTDGKNYVDCVVPAKAVASYRWKK